MTYLELVKQITDLSLLSNVDFFIVGKSTMGQEIYGLHIGDYESNQILIEGGIHAREYPSSLVVIGIAKYLASLETFPSGGIYIIPLANPDGARIVLDGVDWLNCENQRDFILKINGGDNFSDWKAGATTVDLNVNFDALWGEGSQNVFCPAPANFIGFYPNSEREVRLLIDFTFRVQPSLTLSFHTKGEVIYYGFEILSDSQIQRDKEIANLISTINGYIPIKTENSVGGYSDFVSLTLGVPAFTIEIGPSDAPTPIPLEFVDDAIEVNKNVPIALLNKLNGVQNEL